ncbi:Transposase, ISXO2-like domain-containing protein [Strongyloides ratti]|uniref:Transposase, ISXO2-like domain-containing protein n=1 Tax=Strongyloides ratti TaxID=34506 RepID=A0A090KZR8_STRRB|nr:Transposase, ISXO2-like domain-containing protein [Strongyloides ratti]CEF61367.1 Transposase, ISXO2-like domain-containing protein [Strongyloides ratti]
MRHTEACWKDTCMNLLGGRKINSLFETLNNEKVLIADLIDENQSIIGGEEVVVEIDETKVGKRKYNKSHRVDGVWVVGGVERTKKRCVFAVNVEKRDNKTLLDVVKKHVATRLNRTHRLLEVIQ